MATAAQGAQQTDPDLDPTHITHPQHAISLLHSFIVGFIALANQQQVVIPALR